MSNTDINIDILDKIKDIFIIYIIVLYNTGILKIDNSIDIIFGFYKINFNIIENKFFFIKINNYLLSNNKENNDFLKLSKYMTFIYVVSKINKDIIQLIKNINNCKLYKSQNRKINLYELDIFNGELYQNNTIFTCLKNELEFIKKYIESYEFFGKKNNLFTFGFLKSTEKNQNLHKNELIERIDLLFKQLGYKLINFILNKKNRNKDKSDYLEILDIEYLQNLEYKEILKYFYKLFNEINNNLDSFLKDFEFCKYLKVILITFVDDHVDKISIKLHEKLIKKYVIE